MRVGIGYDVHELVKGRKLVLGGVQIPFKKGLKGHSDADVLTHAIIDAILGAMGEGDIGYHFPDTNPKYKNISSLILLSEVCQILKFRGYTVKNLDATVVAEEPKLSPYTDAMRRNLAGVLGIGADRVNVKGKTSEGLGFIGEGKGMAAYATCLLEETRF